MCSGGFDLSQFFSDVSSMNLGFYLMKSINIDEDESNINNGITSKRMFAILSNLFLQCTNSTQCSSVGTLPVCDVNGNRDTCVQCIIDEECQTATFPKCLVDEHRCVGCTSSLDCIATGGLTLPVCNLTTYQCQECLTSGDCIDKTNKICSQPAGKCVECTQNSECGDPNPVCDVATNTCVPCLQDNQCPFGGVCVDKTCKDCRTDDDCTSEQRPFCSSSNQCSPCQSDAQCSDPTPACDLNNPFGPKCVPCTSTMIMI